MLVNHSTPHPFPCFTVKVAGKDLTDGDAQVAEKRGLREKTVQASKLKVQSGKTQDKSSPQTQQSSRRGRGQDGELGGWPRG